MFFPDLASEAVSHATFDKSSSGDLAIDASGVESLNFGDVLDVRGLYLEVSGNCYLRLNGSVDNIPVTLAPDAMKAKVFLEVDITSVIIQNTSSTEALTGVYCVWGDPTP
jgi:hypothetical protein